MYDLNQLEKNVITWRKNRGLDQSTSKDAFMKTAEEFGEIAQALNKQNDELLMDAIGDTLVCLVGLAASKNMTLGECLHYAYEEIKDRRGMLKDGLFVKYKDLSRADQIELDERLKNEG